MICIRCTDLINRYTTVQSDSEQTKHTYISAATEAHVLFQICTLNPLKDILLSYALGSSPIQCARAPVHGSTGVSMIILRCLRSISCFCVVWQAALGANVVTAIQFLLQRAGENASSVLRLDTAGAAVQARCGYARRLPTAALSHPLDVAAWRRACQAGGRGCGPAWRRRWRI